MFGPVCRWLADRQTCTPRVLSLCELRGFSTPTNEILSTGASCKKMIPMRLSKTSFPRKAVRKHGNGRLGRLLRALVWYGIVRYTPETKENGPNLVVLPNDTAYPYDILVHQLRARGIPFLLMQEGIRFELPSIAKNGRQYGQGGANAVATWGAGSAEYFERIGVAPPQIYLVGNPRLDDLKTRDWSDSAGSLAKRLGIASEVLLYVTNPIDQQGFCTTAEKYSCFLEFVHSADSFLTSSGYQLLVKIHTGESLEGYRAALKDTALKNHAIIVKDEPLYPLLHLARAVVTLASTTGLEALLMDRPLGVLPIPGHGYVYDFVENAGAVALDSTVGLEDLLTTLVNDPLSAREKRNKYIGHQISNLGCAAEANGRLIMQLIQSQEDL